MTTTNNPNPARPLSAFDEVLLAVPAEDRGWVGLEAHYLWNMGGGRPSDAARSAVRAYQSGRLTYESFRAAQED